MPTIAILYPGRSAEDEFQLLAELLPGCAFPVIRTWEGPTQHDVTALLELGSEEVLRAAALETQEHSPDAVMWACTSGSFVHGLRGCREQAERVRRAAGAPASSTSLAFLAAARVLGARRVSIAATYPAEVAARFEQMLSDDGLHVAALESFDVPTGEDAGRLDDQWVLEAARRVDTGGSDALLIPDTALHTIELLPRLEEAVGIPVLTANQVTAWHGLALAGSTPRADGLGTLFDR